MKAVAIEIKSLLDWVPLHAGPLVIAGPCSAESEEQVMVTAHAVARLGTVQVFRAGIWKPQTRPHSRFEGVGEQGLEWLRRVQEETSLRVAVEVVSAHHVELCLKAGIDILWIGARTTVSPASVQEIASALCGVEVPVMVKNPVCPELPLWLGAFERLSRAGINRLIAIHRGFSGFESATYLNVPQWTIPIELRRLAPGLPILCNPTHIAANRKLVPEISQKAVELGMDGLMIETHVCPEEALSGRERQVTPDQLAALLLSLAAGKPSNASPMACNLELLRSRIDNVDRRLLELISQRMSLIREVGVYKSANRKPILQIERWRELVEERLELSKVLGLAEDVVMDFLNTLHYHSLREQQTIYYDRLLSEQERDKLASV
jgi:chorismate mutase